MEHSFHTPNSILRLIYYSKWDYQNDLVWCPGSDTSHISHIIKYMNEEGIKVSARPILVLLVFIKSGNKTLFATNTLIRNLINKPEVEQFYANEI